MQSISKIEKDGKPGYFNGSSNSNITILILVFCKISPLFFSTMKCFPQMTVVGLYSDAFINLTLYTKWAYFIDMSGQGHTSF